MTTTTTESGISNQVKIAIGVIAAVIVAAVVAAIVLSGGSDDEGTVEVNVSEAARIPTGGSLRQVSFAESAGEALPRFDPQRGARSGCRHASANDNRSSLRQF